jgi:hypothetical protein
LISLSGAIVIPFYPEQVFPDGAPSTETIGFGQVICSPGAHY